MMRLTENRTLNTVVTEEDALKNSLGSPLKS